MPLQSDTVRASQELVFKPISVPNFIILWSAKAKTGGDAGGSENVS